MKHFSLFLFLVLGAWLRPASARAQSPDSLSQKLASIFANLDKRQVPTGYLYEAGVRFLEPRYYDGALSDSNLTDMNVLRYLRAQLRSSRVYGQDTLPSLPVFNARVKAAAAAGGAIPVAVQYLPYASIRPEALQNNLLRAQDEQLFDVAGRSQTPYQTNTLFAAAPALAYAPTNVVSFLFRRNLYLTGNGAVPSTIELDFGDGRGYQSATWGQPLGTTYSSVGRKRVQVRFTYAIRITSGRFTFTDMQSYESWFDLNVQSMTTANRYDPNYGFSKYVGVVGARYGATMSVRYGRGHGPHVVKPFIVVEQYNIAKAAPHLVDCNNAENTIKSFLPRIGPDFTNPFDFDNSLEAAGYDLIYIDFEYNTDDITRNARVFERVLQEVAILKNESQSQFGLATSPNVVMGMSMGGLIARYGLAEMTKNNSLFGAPDTRLLVLHDSPQRGAYNPVGLQSFSRSTDVPLNVVSLNPFSSGFLGQPSIADFDDRLRDAVNVLNEPATQQLAILNALNGRGDIRPNTFVDGAYSDMVDFTRPANTGGPQPAYRIVATSDGSQCGRGSGAPLGVQLSSADTYTSNWLAPAAAIIPFSLGVRGGAYGLPAYGQQAIISRMRVYIEYRIRIGYGPVSISIPIRFNLLNESASSPPNTLPYETLPGGTTNLDRESGGCGNTGGIVGAFLKTSLYNGDICFVPSYSALDVPAVAPATAFAKYISNTTDNPRPPRVARYLAQANPTNSPTGYNLNHLTFTARNGEWIYDQMEDPAKADAVACSTECLALTITSSIGSQRLCAGTSATFSLPNLPAGTVVTWSATPTSLFTTTAGSGATFTTSAVTGARGTGTVTATVGPCNTPVSVSVPVGPGEPTGRYFSGAYVSGAGTPLQTVNPAYPDKVSLVLDGAYNFTFTANPSSVSVFVISGNSASFYMPSNAGVTITATATNTGSGCGVTGSFAFTPRPYSYGFAYAPNPASTELTVTTVDAAGQPAPAEPFDADLYDTFGKKVKTKKSDQGKAVLDVRDLPSGLYNLRAGKGKNALSEHVQVTH